MSYYSPLAFITPNPGKDTFAGNGTDIGGEDYYNNADEGRHGYNKWVSAMAPQGGIFGDWLRNRYMRTRDDYNAQAGQNPTLQWTDYLLGQNKAQHDTFQTMNPTQRGIETNRRQQTLPKARWM